MADYQITIQATCNGLDEIERRLQRILSNNGKTFDIGNPAKDINKQVQQIQKGMASSGKKIGADFSKGFNSGLKTVKSPSLKDTVNSAKKQAKSVQKATKDALKIDSSLDEKTAKQIANQYVNQQVRAEQRAQAEIQKIRNASNKQQQRDFEKLQSQSNKILADQQQKSYAVKDAEIESKVQRYAGLNKDLVNSYRSAYKNLNDVADSYSSDKSINNMERLVKANDDYARSVKTLGNEFKIASINGDKLASSKKIADLQRSLDKYKKDNNRISKTPYGSQIDSIISELGSGKLTNGQVKGIEERIADIKKSVQVDDLGGKNIFSTISDGFKQFGSFALSFGGIDFAIQKAAEMGKNVLDINSAMIELRKVSTASDKDITNYYDEAAAAAKKYGAGIDEVINSTADWSRLGYGLDEAKELSNATTLLQRVGDNMTQESSSQGLISTLKGFSKEADEAVAIVDAANEVANTQPIDTAGIFSALQRSASSLSAAGNTYQESMAMITAANSVVQDPDSVGTAFKTMAMRIRGASTEMEAAGLDTEGMATSTAKLREEMIALSGVDIMKDANTFKSTYQILDELADRWSGLTDIQQASVTELVAGKKFARICRNTYQRIYLIARVA